MRIVTPWQLSQGEIEGSGDGFLEAVFGAGALAPPDGTETRESLASRITVGGFPEATTLRNDVARTAWMRDYVNTMLERDIREIMSVADRIGLPRLFRLLAARSATLVNVSDLARVTGIPRGTTDRYIALFVTTFMVRFVPAWSGDVGKRLLRTPKILFVDSGVWSHLVGVDARRLVEDPDQLGTLLETFVGGELLRQIGAASDRYELMHYRDASGAEVDWIIEDGQGRLVGIEVKSTSNPSSDDFRGLRSFAAAVGDRFHRGVLLHTGTTTAMAGDRLWAVPVHALWRAAAPRR